MDYWVCFNCDQRFPNIFDEHEAKCPDCENPMGLYATAVTPITRDSLKILTGLVRKTKD